MARHLPERRFLYVHALALARSTCRWCCRCRTRLRNRQSIRIRRALGCTRCRRSHRRVRRPVRRRANAQDRGIDVRRVHARPSARIQHGNQRCVDRGDRRPGRDHRVRRPGARRDRAARPHRRLSVLPRLVQPRYADVVGRNRPWPSLRARKRPARAREPDLQVGVPEDREADAGPRHRARRTWSAAWPATGISVQARPASTWAASRS